MTKIINLQPKDYRDRVKAWILKYDLVVVFIIIAFCWLLLASKWCRQQHREGVQVSAAQKQKSPE